MFLKLVSSVSFLFSFTCLLWSSSFQSVKSDVNCYVGNSLQKNLPSNVTKGTYKVDNWACAKHYRYSTVSIDGIKTNTIEYKWGALDLVLSDQLNLKCGDVVETTYAVHDFLKPVNDTYNVYYDRFCTCCGDLCNDRSLNDKCNEFPDFTHNCYISFALDVPKNPQLPEYFVNYPCTSTQSCFKQVDFMIEPDQNKTVYTWGCAGYSSVNSCRTSVKGSLTPTMDRKLCTCCGDLCNGHSMDDVTFDGTYCRASNIGSFNLIIAVSIALCFITLSSRRL